MQCNPTTNLMNIKTVESVVNSSQNRTIDPDWLSTQQQCWQLLMGLLNEKFLPEGFDHSSEAAPLNFIDRIVKKT